eukprot:COSAG04_NODE_3493_length_2772_cov_37.823793_1_plen_91_part_10
MWRAGSDAQLAARDNFHSSAQICPSAAGLKSAGLKSAGLKSAGLKMMPPTYGRGGREPEPEPQRVDTTAASLGSDGSTVGAGLGDLRSAPP